MSDYLDFDSPDDELRDNEFPDEPIEDGDTDTSSCPHCGSEIYEDSVQCPVCGEYITSSGTRLAGWPVWWLILGLAGILATVLALAGVFGR